MDRDLEPLALPFIVLQGLLFGSTLVASRFSVGQFQPLLYIGIRLFSAALIHLAVYLFSARRLPRDSDLWRNATIYGVVGTALPMAGIVSSLRYQSSGLTSMLIALSPAFTIVLAHYFLPDERLTPRKALGVLLAFGGAFFLAARGETGLESVSQARPLGYLLVLGANLFIGLATIHARRTLKGQDDFDVSSVRMFVSGLLVLPIALFLYGPDLSGVDSGGFFALGYATLIGTFGGSLVSFYVVNRFGATASAMPTYVIPVVASLLGIFLLGEQFTMGMFVAMLFILAGLLMINREPVALST